MPRQSVNARTLTTAICVVLFATVAGCGIKGPLRPPPKRAPAQAPPATTNPATPPATTSPALPPPNATNGK